jgi:hypothetical protein
MDGDECSVYASNYRYSTFYWYKAFDKKYGSNTHATILNLTKDPVNNTLTTPDKSGYLIFYSPDILKINSISCHNTTNASYPTWTNRRPATISIYGANKDSGCYNGTTFDKSKFTLLATATNINNTNNANYTISIVDTHFDENNPGFNYYLIEGTPIDNGTYILFPEIELIGEVYDPTGTAEIITPVRVISQENYDNEINEYGFCGAFVCNNSTITDDDR